jgi:phosphoribosylformylglycinamidine synthase
LRKAIKILLFTRIICTRFDFDFTCHQRHQTTQPHETNQNKIEGSKKITVAQSHLISAKARDTPNMTEKIIHYYRKIETPHSLLPSCKEQLDSLGLGEDADKITDVERESCFNVQLSVSGDLESVQKDRLEWLLAETFEKDQLKLEKSFFDEVDSSSKIWQVEFGPRMTFTSAFSSNACSICQACAIPVERLELSRRYRFHLAHDISEEAIKQLKAMLHDRMTEEVYDKSLTSFDSGASAKPVQTVPIMKEGRAALEKINREMGLGFDDFDLDYYTTLFKVSAQ